MQKVIDFIVNNADAIGIALTAIYELLVRIWPTKKSLSIITNVVKLLNYFVPDRSKGYTTLKKGEAGTDTKHTFTHVIKVLLFLAICIPAQAQLNGNFKSVRFYNADSLTVKTEVSGAQLMYNNVGAIYYNAPQGKFRIFYDSAWHDLIQTGGGGGGVTSLINGLTLSGGVGKLGGALTENTSITSTNTTLDLNQDGLAPTNLLTTSTGINIADGSGSGLILQSSSGGANGALILLDDANMTFQGDAVGFGGAKYAADYSAFFDNRSLPDVGFVSSRFVAGSALTRTGTGTGPFTFSLGGTMTGNVAINSNVANTNTFSIGATTRPTSITFNAGDVVGNNHGNFAITNTTTSMARTLTNPMSIVLSSSGMVVTDLNFTKGLTYAADYSANYTTESIISKRYADARLASKTIATPGAAQTGQSIVWNNSANTWQYFTASSFANNTDINQLMVSQGAGTSSVNSDIEVTAAGSIQLGIAGNTAGATRTINAAGSATDIGITFTAKGASPILMSNRLTTTSTATRPAINIGSFAGDPSTLTNGDLWYNSTTNTLRGRVNGVSVNIPGSGTVSFGSTQQIPFMNGGGTDFSYSSNFIYNGSNLRVGGAAGSNAQLFTTSLSFAGSSGNTVSASDGTSGVTVGGKMTIRAGTAFTGSNANGGDIELETGNPDGSGTAGKLIIDPRASALVQLGDTGVGYPSNTLTIQARSSAASTTLKLQGDNVTLTPAAGGFLTIQNLPTSSAGLPSGAIWNNAGVLSIAP